MVRMFQGVTSGHISSLMYVYIHGQDTITGVYQQGPGGVVPFRVGLNLRGFDFVDYNLRVTNNETGSYFLYYLMSEKITEGLI